MSVRAKKNGIKTPHRVKKPKSAPLEPGEVEIWFTQLRDNSVNLESLNGTIPEFVVGDVFDWLLNYKVPINRAIWCIKCVTAASSQLSRFPTEEKRKFWTERFTIFLNVRLEYFENSPAWQQDIQYSAELSVELFRNRMVDNNLFILWIVHSLRSKDVYLLPCLIHFLYLFWPVFGEDYYAKELLDSLVSWLDRPNQDQIKPLLQPILWKLLTTNKNIMIAPHYWPRINIFLTEHPSYSEIMARNLIFLKPFLCDSAGTFYDAKLDQLLNDFALPYDVDELISSFESLPLKPFNIAYNVILYTIRLHTFDGIQLCKTILKRFEKSYGLFVGQKIVPYMFKRSFKDFDRRFIACLVNELYRAKIFDLEAYFDAILESQLLEDKSHPVRNFHIFLLHNLAVEDLTSTLRSRLQQMLITAEAPIPQQDLTPALELVRGVLDGTVTDVYLKINAHNTGIPSEQGELELLTIYKSRLVNGMIDMVRKGLVYFDNPETLANFCRLLLANCDASFTPLMDALCLLVNIKVSNPEAISAAIRLFRLHIMVFASLGQVENFINHLCAGVQSKSGETPHLAVCADDVDSIKACIKDPHVLFRFEKIIPHRNDLEFSHSVTPSELVSVHQLLGQKGPLDINELLSISHEDDFASYLKTYTQRPLFDRLSVLKLICYQAVTLDELWDDKRPLELLKFLLLFPAQILGFRFDELTSLKEARLSFTSKLSADLMIRFLDYLSITKTDQTLVHHYSETCLQTLIYPALEDYPLKQKVLTLVHTKSELNFDYVFAKCTPFSLRYFQGVVLLILSENDIDTNCKLILQAAYNHPHAMTFLYEIFAPLSPELKELLLIQSVKTFLDTDIKQVNSDFLDVSSVLFEITKDSVTPTTVWPVSSFEKYLEQIIIVGETVDNSNPTTEIPARALTLIIQILIMGSMQSFNISELIISRLKTIIDLETFPYTVSMRTQILDCYRLLALKPRENQQPGMLAITDGLKLYSRTTCSFSDLPLSYFDLIEDTHQVQEPNSYPIDLNLFETYKVGRDHSL